MAWTRKTEQLQIRVSPGQKRHIESQARAAGKNVSEWVLDSLLGLQGRQFEVIVHALSVARRAEERTSLATLHDLLEELTPAQFETALPCPQIELPPRLMNIVAAMIEHAAQRKAVNPPVWTSGVRPLAAPEFATDLQGLRLHLLVNSPVAFRRRNLFVDASVGDRV